ncbi:MAG: hypothetical protein COW03_17000 [Cytophagales bacterium CG12_big_fil_rev_8_21_14_0_65_40_12]|nr:MAG: hypothetical protein COW03_17000 [Cytophagales bacterium CG12_big_fil_rev_8_21_14_0_65_40_12]PIW05683.1 MAG: hypothetical protein COW40_03350 [Cytophagales bacterium CG17_big_fil_post_rev_8_21_14_2_50_40_13]
MACTSDKRNAKSTKFQKIVAKPTVLREIKIDYERHFNVNKLIIEDDLLYILQPFMGKATIISLSDGRIINEIALRKTEPKGNEIYLKGGIAIDIKTDKNKHYVLETGTPKILEYNSSWDLINTHHLSIDYFVYGPPGIFELIDGELIISTIDDFQGRITYGKRSLKADDPLLISYNLKEMELKEVINAKTFLQGAETDSIPFFSMTTYDGEFYFTSKYDASLHKFSKNGKYISKDKSYANYIGFKEGIANSNRDLGIFDVFIDSKNLTYFIEREATDNELSKFEVVSFDLQKETYWEFELDKNNVLLSFKNDQLHYLKQTDEGNTIVTLKFVH